MTVLSIERWIGFILGILVGIVLGWLIAIVRRRSSIDSRLETELRLQLNRGDQELGLLRHQASQSESARAGAEASRLASENLRAQQAAELESLRQLLANTQSDLAEARVALATARSETEAGRQLLGEQRRFQEDNERETRNLQQVALKDLREAFQALSSEALRNSAPEFLRLAGETFARFQESSKGELSLKEQRIEGLVKPLEEQLKAYQQKLQISETQQATALGEVRRHLESLAQQSSGLSSETQRLRSILNSNQARGRWGEETLRRVVESAGMSAHCDFIVQAREGESQPDLIVRLPGERVIIVDAKVPDLDFLFNLGVVDDSKRSELLATHAVRLRSTIKSLSDRKYPEQFGNALDYVVLFIPAESLFSAALEGDRDLIVWASERRILLTTPGSLIALLRSVSMTWQQHEQFANSRQIAEAAQELYARVTTFVSHLEKLRKGMASANDAFDATIGSYERTVRPSGERLVRLNSEILRELPEIHPLDAELRSPTPFEQGITRPSLRDPTRDSAHAP